MQILRLCASGFSLTAVPNIELDCLKAPKLLINFSPETTFIIVQTRYKLSNPITFCTILIFTQILPDVFFQFDATRG